MRLAISNIAWDRPEEEAVALLLRRFDVDAIDVAPGKYFPDPLEARTSEIRDVRSWWKSRGIEITGMQALLFGTTGLNLFAGLPVRAAMLGHLGAICRIGAGLGATRLVFGSPRNRDRAGLGDDAVLEIAIEFFRRLGDIATECGVAICLEPNPPRYGGNFMIGTDEAAHIVRLVGHSAIHLQLDSGALAINGEDPETIVKSHGPIIGHVHASEPDLVPLGDADARHADVASALERHTNIRLVTIEMVETRTEPPLAAIGRALRVADRCYRGGASGAGITT